MSENRIKQNFKTIIGWMAIVLFIAIYGIELLPHRGAPVTIRWLRHTFGQAGLILLNIGIMLAFLALFAYRKPSKGIWASRGAFMAFVIALMTEMFGWPLVIFILSPVIKIPILAPKMFQNVGHWPATIGTAFSITGILLIALGWIKIHRATGLVTDGIYRYLRHPQYTGIFLFTLGWIMHWPSFITLILWPILMAAYVWLSFYEEKQIVEEFGESYLDYAKRTKRFIPFIV